MTKGSEQLVPPAGGAGGRRQVWAMLRMTIGLMGMLLVGYSLGIVSGAMQHAQEDLGLTTEDTEIAVSILLVWATISSALGVPANSLFGRRPVIALAALFYAGGALGVAAADGLQSLVLARSMLGVGVGLASGTVPVYSAEVSPPNMRGVLLALTDFGVVIGLLVAAVVNVGFWHVDAGWRWAMGLGAVPALMMLLGTPCLPESPRWLAMKGRPEAAEAVLKQIHGTEDVRALLDDIMEAIREEGSDEETRSGCWARLRRGAAKLWSLWAQRGLRRAATLGMGLMIANQLAGINTVCYYSTTILMKAGFSADSSIWLAAVCPAAQLVGVALSVASMDSLGRRPTTLVSCFGVVVSLFALTASLSAGDAWQEVSAIALMVYLVAFGFGLATVPWVMNGELYPLKVRSAAAGQATLTCWIMSWIVGRYFLSLCNSLGEAGAFGIFAVCSLVCAAWLFFVLPETRGLELEDIAELFADPDPKGQKAPRRGGAAAALGAGKARECGDMAHRPNDMQMALRA